VTRGEAKVFISYRREETAGHAGRLYDVMSSHFGDTNVFMDVDIAPGVDFVNRITHAVGACHVLLVIIGPRWATISNGGTLGRIFEPGDFVRLEVEEGLRRSEVAVIPVLVGGARMPEPGALPAPLRALTRRNALELSDTRWRYDVDRLMGALDRLLGDTSAVHKVAAPVTPPAGMPPVVPAPVLAPPPVLAPQLPPEPRGPSGALLVLSTTLIAAAAGLIGRSIAGGLRTATEGYDKVDGLPDWPKVTTIHRVNSILDPLIWNGFTWAVIGAAVAVWLTLRLHGPQAAVGRLITGALWGGLAGVAGTAVYAVHPNVLTSGAESKDTHHALLILGVALTGAIAGALVGWVWRRRASAGLSIGLLAGALWEGAVIATDHSNRFHQVEKACLSAAVIVGLTAATQALLDASAERSSRALVTSRGP
jgi:hypothetical protein